MVDQLPPAVWTVEFDFPLALKVGTQEMRYYFGTQCENGNDGSGTWDIWNPNLQGGSRWVHTSVPCGTIQPNQWHEVRWYGTRTDAAYHYYVLEVDGQQYPIDVWIEAAPTGWSDAFIVQFQTDGDANADGYDMYVDDVQAWVW